MEDSYMGEVKIEQKEEETLSYSRPIMISQETASAMQVKYGGYKGFKAKMDYLIGRTAGDFVEIGQMLKEARDTDILKDSGYSGMGEFAEKEYGLRPDQTSRFIGIFEKFGKPEGGLKEEYQQHGLTKLSEMLSLPDSVAEAIPADLSREEIRQIKDEVKGEQAVTPLEVAMEGQQDDDPLTAMLKAYFHAKPEEFRNLFQKWTETDSKGPEQRLIREQKQAIFDILAPSGVAVLESRPAGLGKILLTFDGEDKEPKLTQIREDQTQNIDWLNLQNTIDEILQGPMAEELEVLWKTPEEAWTGLFGENIPETSESPCEPEKPEAKVKIAPAQTEKAKEHENPHEEEHAEEADLPMPKPESEEDPARPLRGTQEARESLKVIKDKTAALKLQLSAIGHIRADEEQYVIQDAMEKYENATQELQDALNDLSMLRLKEEQEEGTR